MFEFHDIEQNTDEWLQLRCGRLTSSNLGKVMANFGKSFGEPAKRLAAQIAVQQITGKCESNGFSNEHTERGHEQEPVARMLYEERFFCDVGNGGFFSTKDLGCSPDGLVLDSGAVEIKSVIAATHFATVKRQNVDPAYRWQYIGNLKFTGRDWLDFISYCSEFPADKQLYIHRLNKSDMTKEFDMIDSRVEQFMALVATTKETILESNYSN
ncbi:MAG: YqaJ-like viral recombinase [Rickettsiales bacterium]|nr:MAG: YqaJ-like viral recombinase [Rickettsiales bacterium]